MKRTIAGIAGAALAAAALVACSSAGDDAGGVPGNVETAELRIGNFADLTTWDTALADIGFNAPYLSAVYDPLLTINGEGQPQPALVTEWEYSEDMRTLVLQLRDDAKFSDGETFDADAAVVNLEYLQHGAISGEAYSNVESFEAEGDSTVIVHLTERDDRLLYFMGLGRSYMASPAAIASGTLADNPVGSGPYLLDDSTIIGTEYHFTKVDGHWADADFPYEKVSVLPVQDPTARNNAMEAGQFDVIYADAGALEMAEQHDWNVDSQVATWVGLRINDHTGSQLEPLGDVRVRQALNYAFDGKSMLEAIGQGEGKYTTQLFAAGFPGNDPELDDRYAHDMDKAKRLLKEAGYGAGFDVTLPMAPPFQAWQATIEQVFGDLGISVRWDEVQYSDYQATAPSYPMFIAVLAVDSEPAATIARQLTVPQWYMPDPDISEFPELQQQIDAALSAPRGDEQNVEMRKLSGLLTEDAWNVVWYQANNTYVTTENIDFTPVTGMMFPSLRQIQPAS